MHTLTHTHSQLHTLPHEHRHIAVVWGGVGGYKRYQEDPVEREPAVSASRNWKSWQTSDPWLRLRAGDSRACCTVNLVPFSCMDEQSQKNVTDV
jgi:hypothetical protein